MMQPDSTQRAEFVFNRRCLLVTCFIGHCLYYITRKSITYTIPVLLEDDHLNLTKEDFGIMASVQMTTYTIGKFLTGFLVDRISCKRIFCFGLLCCGMVNISFGVLGVFGGGRQYFFVFTFFNGLFQACGWNAIAVLIKKWYDKSDLGAIWSLLSSTINIGTSVTPFIIMAITKDHHWRSAFLGIGIFTCIFSVLSVFTIQEQENTIDKSTKNTTKKQNTFSPFKVLGTSWVFWILSVCYALWSLVRGGTEDWLQLYLISERALTAAEASFNVMVFQIGGFVASLFSGGLSDKAVVKFGSKMRGSPRLLLIIFCSTTSVIWFYLLHFVKLPLIPNTVVISTTAFMLGMCCYVPHTLFGLLAVESAPMEMSGTAHALATTVSSVGSVLGGYPLVYISSNYGWNGAYSTLMLISLITSTLLVTLTRMDTKIKREKTE